MRTFGDRRGVVLLLVLFFTLLLAAGITGFVRRAAVDSIAARNHDQAGRAAAIARGGIRLAEALLLEDRLLELEAETSAIDTADDLWAAADLEPIEVGGGLLRLRIEDTAARFNLNSLFEDGEEGLRKPHDLAEPFLVELFTKVISEMPLPPGERALYDPHELTANLIDWIDADELRQQGGPEDEYYEAQSPPYSAANQPLLSLDELRLIEGFDGPLIDALLPYVTVYPYAPGGCNAPALGCGINLNTAPPHVLALLYYDDGVDLRLAEEDLVRQILEIRQEGSGICGGDQSLEDCTPISELVTNAIFPPPTITSNLFLVTADAQVGDVRRSVQAVVDRTRMDEPRLLSWRVR